MKFIKLIAFAFVQAARASNNIDDIVATSGNAEVVRQLANETETTTASTVVAESTEVAVTTTAAPEVDPATADGFAPVDGDFSMVSSLTINGGIETTIQPSTVPFVSTYPADVDFVTPIVDGESLTIEIDAEAVEGISSPKLRIGLPPDQVKSIYLPSGKAEVLNGFTSVEKLQFSFWTKAQADLSSNTNPDLQVLVPYIVAEANVIADVIGYVSVVASATATIQAKTVSEIMVDSASKLYVDGNVGSGSVSNASFLSVSGDVEGHIDVSSSARISANTISGSVTLTWSASATASSCDNVKGGISEVCTVMGLSGGPLGSSISIATSAVMMFATLLVL